jgi:hypothetical protein
MDATSNAGGGVADWLIAPRDPKTIRIAIADVLTIFDSFISIL